MILILSMHGDLSTDLVIDWLRKYNHSFVRLDLTTFLDKPATFSLFPPALSIDEQAIDIHKIQAVWYRRTGAFGESQYFKNHKENLTPQTTRQLYLEYEALTEGFATLFHDKYWLNHPQKASVNKLEVLNIAQQCGLPVPKTYVVNTQKQLATLSKNHSLICKSIYEPDFLDVEDKSYMMYTAELTPTTIQNFPQRFYPSLVQQKIDKAYELRIFYMEGQLYPMAIFSQQATQTQLDFRQYNRNNPNRNVPYNLSQKLTTKLQLLMQKLDLNCGSIDIIKGIDEQYYFLEVNPVGQFGMTSKPCNYDLHQLIAQHLIKKDSPYEKVPHQKQIY